MSLQTPLTRRLNLGHPIVQAPMAGGTTTVDLVAAVCEAGALGFFGAAYLTPEQIEQTAHEMRARSNRPFGINLFAPTPVPEPPPRPQAALERIAPFHAALGLAPPTAPAPAEDPFAAQIEPVLESGAAVFSFTFGIPPAAALDALKARGTFVIGTATTVDEAIALERAGVDAIACQGSEAGAHRGTFASAFEDAMVGTIALTPQVVDAVSVPVIASGGIMDGRGLAAALALGADAAQMGTAFLASDESGTAEAHKRALTDASESATRVTRVFSGRPARGIVNRFMQSFDEPRDADAILPYPLQNALTRGIRKAAAEQGDAGCLSLWSGQGVRMARREPAADLVARISAQAESVLAALAPR